MIVDLPAGAAPPRPCRICRKLPDVARIGGQHHAAHAERDKPFCLLGGALFFTWSEDAGPAVDQWNEAMAA
jgi:hypothetical protein